MNRFYCIETLAMCDGKVAFKKGDFYNGAVNESGRGTFKSKLTRGMNHGMKPELISKHLKLFKFGR